MLLHADGSGRERLLTQQGWALGYENGWRKVRDLQHTVMDVEKQNKKTLDLNFLIDNSGRCWLIGVTSDLKLKLKCQRRLTFLIPQKVE